MAVTMKELLECGVHFGHQTRRWNPKMAEYIFAERNGIYIIDLQQTLRMLQTAADFVQDVAAKGGGVLFVGTKRQSQEAVRVEAVRCGMYHVNHRWLGGMLILIFVLCEVQLDNNKLNITDQKRACDA